jgi:uncharacterized protein (TIGR00299 family) protein
MLVSALIDAGGNAGLIGDLPRVLDLNDVDVEITRVDRQGLAALHLTVHDKAGPEPRLASELLDRIDRSQLPRRAKARAIDALQRLADAESRVHGVDRGEVHFHELSGADTLIDVCGTALLLEELEIEQVICSPLPAGRGVVAGAHGALPLPAPATLELLRGAPIVGVDVDRELVTPTGAALAASIADGWGALPPLMLGRIGYGAGTADLPDRPNVVRAIIGERDGALRSELSLIESTIDDLNPELVPDAVEQCLAAGAVDAWTTPVLMKKGRPGVILTALAPIREEQAVARVILEETTTLGVRVSRVRRYELEREQRVIAVAGGSVRVKVGLLDGRVVNIAPEHDDCAALARQTGRSVKSVWALALAAAHEQ